MNDTLISHAIHVARHHGGGLAWRLARDDALQEARIAAWQASQSGTRSLFMLRSALDRLVRDLGWVRMRLPDGSRRWVRAENWLVLSLSRGGYRHAGQTKKRANRMAMPAARRAQIARMGGQNEASHRL